jgi:hypothetical protein
MYRPTPREIAGGDTELPVSTLRRLYSCEAHVTRAGIAALLQIAGRDSVRPDVDPIGKRRE